MCITPRSFNPLTVQWLFFSSPFLMQLTVIMAFISSLLLNPQKCLRLFQAKNTAFCIYYADIALCVVIIALLVPQIVVVRTYLLFCVPLLRVGITALVFLSLLPPSHPSPPSPPSLPTYHSFLPPLPPSLPILPSLPPYPPFPPSLSSLPSLPTTPSFLPRIHSHTTGLLVQKGRAGA